MTSQSTFKSLWQLMRLHRPIGFLLIGWPTLAALWLAQGAMPSWRLIGLFVAGIVITRSAGCIVNDMCDRKFDGHVARTQQRPLASGALSLKVAFILLGFLAIIALLIVSQLNWLCFYLALGGVALTILYPLCKRFLPIPQAVLAITFNWGIFIAFAAVCDHIPVQAYLWLAANAFWTLAYDTQYALMDIEDDVKLGLHSSAVYFGDAALSFILLCQGLMILLLIATGLFMYLGVQYYIAIIIVIALFIYQFNYTKTQSRPLLMLAFKNNNWVGLVLFLAIVVNNKFLIL
jgi:4-hydroxybenzoate polyprenyltransferase